MDVNISRSCPVCGGDRKKRIYQQKFADVTKVTFLKGYDVVICEDCGAGFADHIPPQTEFEKYYINNSKYEFENIESRKAELDLNSKIYKARFKRIEKYLVEKGQRSKILDLGCATGDFLRTLKERGFTNLMGLDPSKNCVNYMMNVHGIEARQGTFSNMLIDENEQFDLITMTWIAEHIVDFSKYVETISAIVKENGIVYLELPDVNRFAETEDAPFQEFSTEHINYFSARSLENAFKRHGFVRDDCEFDFIGNEKSKTPSIHISLRKTNIFNYSITSDFDIEKSLIQYVQNSAISHHKINLLFKELAKSQEPIIVWGVGTNTLRFLEQGDLGRCNIIAFVDSNPYYIGGTWKKIKIIASTEVYKFSEKIILSTIGFSDAILRVIKEELQLQNEIVGIGELL